MMQRSVTITSNTNTYPKFSLNDIKIDDALILMLNEIKEKLQLKDEVGLFLMLDTEKNIIINIVIDNSIIKYNTNKCYIKDIRNRLLNEKENIIKYVVDKYNMNDNKNRRHNNGKVI